VEMQEVIAFISLPGGMQVQWNLRLHSLKPDLLSWAVKPSFGFRLLWAFCIGLERIKLGFFYFYFCGLITFLLSLVQIHFELIIFLNEAHLVF